MLADTARRAIAHQSPPTQLRRLAESGADWDEDLWRTLGGMGFPGAAIGEADGGLGLGDLDLAVIAQELGRAAAAVPFLSSVGMAAELIALAGSPAQRAAWLPQLAGGSLIGTFAYAEGGSDAWSALPQTVFANGRLSGEKWPVADLAIATIAIVACQCEGRPALAALPLDQPGVVRSPLAAIDPTRPLGMLRLDGAAAELLDTGDIPAILDRLLDRAAMLLAFEQIGGAEACLDMARDYVAGRRVFGRTLASYQAIKHKLADLYVAIELARSNAYFAAWAITTDAPERAAAAATARLSALEAYEQAARENLQVHGGIGYTWDADCHFHYRRERLLCAMLGGRGRWADRLIAVLASPLHAA